MTDIVIALQIRSIKHCFNTGTHGQESAHNTSIDSRTRYVAPPTVVYQRTWNHAREKNIG